MKNSLVIGLCIIITLLGLSTGAHALTKFDYLAIDHTECGVMSCTTYYTATNPTTTSLSVSALSLLQVNNKIEYKGKNSLFKVEYYNGTGWMDETKIISMTLAKGEKARFRITGNFTPVYNGKDQVTYSIDHVPSFNGFVFPEYDLWNQTFNKCLDINVTYNLGAYTQINETFPLRVSLNSTVINLSAIRSDWGDIRFTKGTCANVTTDYSHNFVMKNSTNAQAIVYLGAGDIVNNTAAHIAVYYNNTGITHLEPTRTGISFGGAGTVSGVRIFTNDKTDDNATNSSTAFNDTTSTLLTSVNIASIVMRTPWNNAKELTQNTTLSTPVGFDNGDVMSNIRGVSTGFAFNLYREPYARTIRLYTLGNNSDASKTNILTVDLVIT